MSIEEAKLILSSARPGGLDEADPEVREALALVKADPGLAAWYEEQRAFDVTITRKLREAMPCPPGLQARLLAGRPIVRPAAFWRRHAWLTAAACLMLMSALGAWLSGIWPREFRDFETAMTAHSAATPDDALRAAANFDSAVKSLAKNGAYTNFVLSAGLTNQTVFAFSSFSWEGHRVSALRFKLPGGGNADFYALENPRLQGISHNCEPEIPDSVGDYAIAYWYGHRNDFYLVTAPKAVDIQKLVGASTP